MLKGHRCIIEKIVRPGHAHGIDFQRVPCLSCYRYHISINHIGHIILRVEGVHIAVVFLIRRPVGLGLTIQKNQRPHAHIGKAISFHIQLNGQLSPLVDIIRVQIRALSPMEAIAHPTLNFQGHHEFLLQQLFHRVFRLLGGIGCGGVGLRDSEDVRHRSLGSAFLHTACFLPPAPP